MVNFYAAVSLLLDAIATPSLPFTQATTYSKRGFFEVNLPVDGSLSIFFFYLLLFLPLLLLLRLLHFPLETSARVFGRIHCHPSGKFQSSFIYIRIFNDERTETKKKKK